MLGFVSSSWFSNLAGAFLQVEKAFREGTARQNAHSIFVCLALKLLEERVHVACKEIITLEKQMKLLEEEEKEKREEEERRERRRTKEREKKLRRKERLREKENREKKCAESNSDPVVTEVSKEESTPCIDECVDNVGCRDSFSETDILDGEFGNTRDWNTSFPYDHFKYSRRKLKFRKDLQRDLNLKWSDRRKGATLSENGGIINKYESRYHADGFESTRGLNGFSKQLRTNAAKSNIRNCSKLSEKFSCTHNRVGDRYDPHACSCNHHHDYRSRPEFHITRVVRDPRYVNKLESPSDLSKPYYRGNKFTQVDCAREINGRPRSKIIAANPPNTKKVWEPLDSQKKCVRSNSDSDVTLRSTPKVEASESDQLPESCSTSSDEVTDISVHTNHEDTDVLHLTRSRAENCGDLDNGFLSVEKPQNHSKEDVADGELCPTKSSPLGTLDSSMSSSSNSDNCSSCLSEGESNMYSNPQNLESTSTSDSEESNQNSEGREASDCIENGITASNRVVEGQNASSGQEAKIQGPVAAATNSSGSLLKEATPDCDNGRVNVSMSAQPQCMLPQMHNQSISYPLFQAPTMGYYHQNPVSWPAAPTNGLMSFPHSNHYLYANTFGYGLNGNARFLQYGALQHLGPPLLNHAHVPVFQPVSQVNGVSTNEPSKVAHVSGLKEAQHSMQKVVSSDQHPANAPTGVDAGQNGKADKMDLGNNGFSLFHFGGPVALSAGFKADPVSLKDGTMGDASPNSSDNSTGGDHPSNKKDSIEEYNLFAATNGIKFSIF
ncbi:UNVERIFIED_CONTAM: hypothetical protein Sangu_0788700 [Sesamum angustifolium]|uniref:Uncharacterized protein n=1 Tax=Sesamum angustifolium TaxID=2727405 RepID=A0AAW2PV86_9LAMI